MIMASRQFDLPPGTKALSSSKLDTRTEEEIIESLLNPNTDVTSQKNVWAFWDKGFAQMHGWQKRNVIGWARKLGPSWTIRVVDYVEGSVSNLTNYVDSEDLAESVLHRTMSGAHLGQHVSDLLRVLLLYKYGGIYLDVGVMVLGDLEEIFWKKISDPQSPYRIGGFAHEHRKNSWGSLQMFCIVAEKGEEILLRWHRVMLAVWKGRTSSAGITHHPIFDGVPSEPNPRVLMAIKPGSEGVLLDYWVNLLAWEKLKVTIDETSGFNGPEYIQKHVLLLNPMQEAFAAEVRTRMDTAKLFKMLTTSREATAEGVDPALKAEAKALVDYLLTSSTVMKLYHGHGYMLMKPLATFWEEPGNEDADVKPGTFGEYLRYAGEIIDQQREVLPLSLSAYDGPVVHGALP